MSKPSKIGEKVSHAFIIVAPGISGQLSATQVKVVGIGSFHQGRLKWFEWDPQSVWKWAFKVVGIGFVDGFRGGGLHGV